MGRAYASAGVVTIAEVCTYHGKLLERAMWETPGMPDVYAWRLLDVKLSATTDYMAHHQRWTATGISVRDQSGVPPDFASSEWFEATELTSQLTLFPEVGHRALSSTRDQSLVPILLTLNSHFYSSFLFNIHFLTQTEMHWDIGAWVTQ